MFWLPAVSLSQEGFPTLFCGSLPFQRASFSPALPDRGERAGTVWVAGRRSDVSEKQSGEGPLLEARARASHRGLSGQGALTWYVWAGAGQPPETPPLSLPFLLSRFQPAAAFYLFLCLALSASPFLSSPSSLSPTCFLFFFSFSVCFPSALLQKLHYQHSGILTLLTLSKVMSSTTAANLVDELNPQTFFCLLCYREKMVWSLGSKACQLCFTWRNAAAKSTPY